MEKANWQEQLSEKCATIATPAAVDSIVQPAMQAAQDQRDGRIADGYRSVAKTANNVAILANAHPGIAACLADAKTLSSIRAAADTFTPQSGCSQQPKNALDKIKMFTEGGLAAVRAEHAQFEADTALMTGRPAAARVTSMIDSALRHHQPLPAVSFVNGGLEAIKGLKANACAAPKAAFDATLTDRYHSEAPSLRYQQERGARAAAAHVDLRIAASECKKPGLVEQAKAFGAGGLEGIKNIKAQACAMTPASAQRVGAQDIEHEAPRPK